RTEEARRRFVWREPDLSKALVAAAGQNTVVSANAETPPWQFLVVPATRGIRADRDWSGCDAARFWPVQSYFVLGRHCRREARRDIATGQNAMAGAGARACGGKWRGSGDAHHPGRDRIRARVAASCADPHRASQRPFRLALRLTYLAETGSHRGPAPGPARGLRAQQGRGDGGGKTRRQ